MYPRNSQSTNVGGNWEEGFEKEERVKIGKQSKGRNRRFSNTFERKKTMSSEEKPFAGFLGGKPGKERNISEKQRSRGKKKIQGHKEL